MRTIFLKIYDTQVSELRSSTKVASQGGHRPVGASFCVAASGIAWQGLKGAKPFSRPFGG